MSGREVQTGRERVSAGPAVLLPAAAFALAGGYAVAVLTGSAGAAPIAAITVGVTVVSVYRRRWRVGYDTASRAVAWTVAASALVLAGYAVVHLVAVAALGPGAAVPAFAAVATWGVGTTVAGRLVPTDG